MDMGMVVEILSPSIEHGENAELGAQMLGIGGDRGQGLRRRLEQNGVNELFVLESDLGCRSGQREHHVEVGHRKKFGRPRRKPSLARTPLALRAMAIAAGVVGNADGAAILAFSVWPPSAAVRHNSIALITLRSTRPMWPAWAWR